MWWKKARKICELESRVEELEERICPCSNHEWIQIGTTFEMRGPFDSNTIYHYKCKKCGKKTTSIRTI